MIWLVLIFIILLWVSIRLLVDKEFDTPTSSSFGWPTPEAPSTQRLIAFGDSLTAWYQLAPEHSFPAQLEDILQAQGYTIRVINAGKSGDTSSQMRERLERSLDDTSPGDIFLITAWANDGLQWLPIDQLKTNLLSMIAAAKQRDLIVIIWWMKLPRNYGEPYTTEFDALYTTIAAETETLLIPFILEWVATLPEYNLSDGIHPNKEGYTRIAELVSAFLISNELVTK